MRTASRTCLFPTGAGASGRWKGILRCEDDPIVSSDVTKSRYSCMFDSQATLILGSRLSKTLAWLDAGWSFATWIVEVVAALACLEPPASAPPKGERTSLAAGAGGGA